MASEEAKKSAKPQSENSDDNASSDSGSGNNGFKPPHQATIILKDARFADTNLIKTARIVINKLMAGVKALVSTSSAEDKAASQQRGKE